MNRTPSARLLAPGLHIQRSEGVDCRTAVPATASRSGVIGYTGTTPSTIAWPGIARKHHMFRECITAGEVPSDPAQARDPE